MPFYGTRRNSFESQGFKEGIRSGSSKNLCIEQLPPPASVKGVRGFLGHASFYRRFIKDFSKIAKPLCNLLEKDAPFNFNEECLIAFNELKKKLVFAPIVVTPMWDRPFELMCDANDYAIGVVLGQRNEKRFHPIYYASKTLADT